MKAIIDSVIRVDQSAISPTLLRRVLGELSPPNPDKERAISEMIRDADQMADEISLWRVEEHLLVIPRGFAHRFEQLANDLGESVEWESRMRLFPSSRHCFRDWPAFELRDYQIPARDAMIDWGQGILSAPTGSGKSIMALEFTRWTGQPTLVIVGKTALARQWQEAVSQRYGYSAGYIGEGEWDEKDFTVALWQSLWAKDVDPAFWARWGSVIVDEVHHSSAASLYDLIGRFPAFYRIGLSATPRWDPLLFPVVEAIIGPIVHKTEDHEAGENLVTPRVVMIETDFQAEYKPTHFVGRKRVQNNYGEVLGALVADPDRNDLIARIAREEAQEGHHVLIVTRRIEHVKQLVSRLEKVFRIGSRLHTLTGAQTGADAQRIGRAIENAKSGTILISTVADEALDHPRLDRLIMAFPLRRLPLVEQQIGRIRRPAGGKSDAIAYDVCDPDVGPLRSQRKDRSQMYARRGWKVERVEREESKC